MNLKNGKKEFTPQELENALMHTFDLFERAVCIWFPLGQTAYSIKNNEWLKGDKIEVGVRKKDLAESTIEMFKSIDPSIDFTQKKIIINHESVPIEIRVIQNHYRFLDQLDQTMYAYEVFYLPNPFDAFWRAYKFIH